MKNKFKRVRKADVFLTLLIIICYNKKLVYWRRNQNIYPILAH